VPVFALLAAGVAVDAAGLRALATDPVPLGIVLGLVVGKAVGVFGGTWVTARFTRASLSDDLSWWDVLGVSLLGGVGFTVALLIGELAFEGDAAAVSQVKAAVLVGSLIAAALAAAVLAVRNGVYRRIDQESA
jgi:NhaA family Na+:H+ antiporter